MSKAGTSSVVLAVCVIGIFVNMIVCEMMKNRLVCDLGLGGTLVYYPEPAFIGAVVGLGLLLPLPPLYQAGSMVPRQTDVTAAGRGTDSAPNTSREEWLCAE